MQQQWLVSLFTTDTEIAKCYLSCSSLVLVCGKGVCWEVSLVKGVVAETVVSCVFVFGNADGGSCSFDVVFFLSSLLCLCLS